jgi:membrane peptidoglycan carboxypeptidase
LTSLAFKILGSLVFVVLVMAAGVLSAGLVTYESYARDLVPPEELAVNRPSAGAIILDRNGKLLYRYVDDKEGLRYPVRLDQVSPAFLAATIATEDANFFTNPGVNVRGLVRAARENVGPLLREEELSGTGGSSITQQLVKNLYIAGDERAERSLDRKARELVFALELTKRYPKTQILEWYVNEISYGGLLSGVEAASQSYFAKPASELTLAEAALLAGIPQSPAAYDPRNNLEAAVERRGQVLDLMLRRSEIRIGPESFYTPDQEEIEAARSAPVELVPPSFPIEAPHFVFSYIAPQLEALVGKDAMLRGGLVVTTSLDLDLQYQAQDNLERWLQQHERSSNTHNGAVAVIKPSTGEILTMLGSRDYWREDIDGRVNNLLAPNSPGSSFKPFVYLASFLNLRWTPGTIIQDTPVTFRESNGTTFSPTNPNKRYNGSITLRNALGNSLNVPAFKTAMEVGVPRIVDFARSVGLTSLDSTYGPAISIGGVDLKPLDLTYAYTVLANGGVMAGHNALAPSSATERTIQPISILKIESPDGLIFNVDDYRTQRRIVPEEHAYMVTDVLSDGGAQCIIFGCGGLTIPGYRVAVKTGTSEPYDPKGPNAGKIGETWAFGYTPDIVVGVWAGNSDNQPIVNIFSTTISYRVMRETLLNTYAGKPQTPFVMPAGLVRRQVCVAAPQEPQDPMLAAQAQQPQQRSQLPPSLFGLAQLIPGFALPELPPAQVCSSDLALR